MLNVLSILEVAEFLLSTCLSWIEFAEYLPTWGIPPLLPSNNHNWPRSHCLQLPPCFQLSNASLLLLLHLGILQDICFLLCL